LFYEYKIKYKLIQYYQQDIQVVIVLHWEKNPHDQEGVWSWSLKIVRI